MVRYICCMLFAIAMLHLANGEDEMSLFVSVVEPSSGDDGNAKASNENPTFKPQEDLCSNHKCDAGEYCTVRDNEAACECIETCIKPDDERQQICTFANKTFESDCHFLRSKCWCKHGDKRCTNPSDILSDNLDYYGACRDVDQCTPEQKRVFPDRMKIWLDEVLHILNERKVLDPRYSSLVQLADKMKANKVEKYWTCGVAFEFCNLDESKDHKIQKEELRALIASIKSLENCIQPFLDECDADNDQTISDKEWAKCLDLSDDDLELLRNHC